MATKPTPPPQDEAQSVQQALAQLQQDKRSPKVTLPNGVRVNAAPYVQQTYQGMDTTQLLGSPGSILKEPRPGHKYVWKKKTDRQTQAWMRAGVLRPVEYEEVDLDNPMAEFVEDTNPTGDKFVSWETLSLFEMPPKWVKKIYEAPENWAIARLAQKQAEFAGEVSDLTKGSFKGKLTVS